MDKLNLGFSIIKFVLGAVCYGLVCYYYGLNDLVAASVSPYRPQYLINHIMVTACVAFTFIIEPAIIAASIKTPKHYFKTFLGHSFSFAGFVCYIISGSLILANAVDLVDYDILDNNLKTPYLATGSIFVITAAIYLAHCVYAGHSRMRSKN